MVAAHQNMLGHQDAPSIYIISRVSLCMLCIYIYIYTNMLFVSRAHAGMSTASAAAEGQGF